jgi:ATP-dependent exoDNAse (exonuclease V) beta subunit
VEPEVRRCVSVDNEAHAIAQWLLGRKAAGYDWAHMAVLYPEHWIGEKFAKILANQGVPVDVAKGQRNRVNAAADAVRLLSMHNAKGLEYPCVAIGGLGALGARRDVALEDDVRLAYVAVTRATHEAYLTYSKRSPLVERIVT